MASSSQPFYFSSSIKRENPNNNEASNNSDNNSNGYQTSQGLQHDHSVVHGQHMIEEDESGATQELSKTSVNNAASSPSSPFLTEPYASRQKRHKIADAADRAPTSPSARDLDAALALAGANDPIHGGSADSGIVLIEGMNNNSGDEKRKQNVDNLDDNNVDDRKEPASDSIQQQFDLVIEAVNGAKACLDTGTILRPAPPLPFREFDSLRRLAAVVLKPGVRYQSVCIPGVTDHLCWIRLDTILIAAPPEGLDFSSFCSGVSMVGWVYAGDGSSPERRGPDDGKNEVTIMCYENFSLKQNNSHDAFRACLTTAGITFEPQSTTTWIPITRDDPRYEDLLDTLEQLVDTMYYWVGERNPQNIFFLDEEARATCGMDTEVVNSRNLTGDGIIVALLDALPNSSHQHLRNKVISSFCGRCGGIIIPDFNNNNNVFLCPGCRVDFNLGEDHGSSMASVLCGDTEDITPIQPIVGTLITQLRGVAPRSRLVALGVPRAFLDDYFKPVEFAYQEGARILSISIGISFLNYYHPMAKKIDNFIFQNKDLCVVMSAGNYHNTGVNGSVTAIAWAANVITVGCCQSPVRFTDRTNAQHFSIPPSGDESEEEEEEDDNREVDGTEMMVRRKERSKSRFPEGSVVGDKYVSGNPQSLSATSGRGYVKPDCVAPAMQVVVHGNRPCVSGGSSISTAIAAGIIALIREFLAVYFGITNPSAALLKAILLNGCVELTGESSTSTSYESNQGYGRVNLENSICNLSLVDNYNEDDSIHFTTAGEEHYYSFDVNKAAPFAVTLAYSVSSDPQLLFSIELCLFDPSKRRHNPRRRISSNVSKVAVITPEVGTWRVVLRLAEAVEFTEPPYAIAVSGEGVVERSLRSISTPSQAQPSLSLPVGASGVAFAGASQTEGEEPLSRVMARGGQPLLGEIIPPPEEGGAPGIDMGSSKRQRHN